jgi:RHS repeat-associated protein
LVERYTYSAYGTLGIYDANGTVRASSTYANRYTYTGREYDADLRLYHFRARWYDPATGGFVARDPLGYVDGMSLYRGYFGVDSLDFSGLYSIDDAIMKHCNEWCTSARRYADPNCWMTCKEKRLCEAFKTWVEMERAFGDWWSSLPKCPCSIKKESKSCTAFSLFGGPPSTYSYDEWVPPSGEWDDPIYPLSPEATLHPGAVMSMRSKSVGGRYNQCIYDSDGKLLTQPPTAGTVDYGPPGTFDHYRNDVFPIIVANHCDGGSLHSFWGMLTGSIRMRKPAGENVRMYYTVRPHWAEDCPANPAPIVPIKNPQVFVLPPMSKPTCPFVKQKPSGVRCY